MTYEEILKELDEVNLKDKFTSIYETNTSENLLKMVKETDRLGGTGTLIRFLMDFLENESEEWLYWQKVLFYFITPKFARKKTQLPNE